MKQLIPILSLTAAVLWTIGAVSHGATESAANVVATGETGSVESLETHMDRIGTTFRTIRRAARDAGQYAECAELTALMLADARASLGFEPSWKGEQPEAQQEGFVAAYREEMQVFISQLEKLEEAFRAGDGAKVDALIGEIREHQKASHERFKKPD